MNDEPFVWAMLLPLEHWLSGLFHQGHFDENEAPLARLFDEDENPPARLFDENEAPLARVFDENEDPLARFFDENKDPLDGLFRKRGSTYIQAPLRWKWDSTHFQASLQWRKQRFTPHLFDENEAGLGVPSN